MTSGSPAKPEPACFCANRSALTNYFQASRRCWSAHRPAVRICHHVYSSIITMRYCCPAAGTLLGTHGQAFKMEREAVKASTSPALVRALPSDRTAPFLAISHAFLSRFSIMGLALWGLPFYYDFLLRQFG